MGYDSRKVQTAVLGTTDSDHPVYLPPEHKLFDKFTAQYPEGEFYCGILLGGCGKQLTPKKYTDRVCHFAHYPPVSCSRIATGDDSADHLFIGRALQSWLRSQRQHRAEAQYFADGCTVGEMVRFDLTDGRTVLVPMSQRAVHLTRGLPGDVIIAYGTKAPVPASLFEQRGYALRFHCRSDNGTREVLIGTQLPTGKTRWTTLSYCRLTMDGIVTPSLVAGKDGLRPIELVQDRPSFPLERNSTAFTGAVPAEDTNAPGVYQAVAQSLGSVPFRAQIVLPVDLKPPQEHRMYVLTGDIRLEHDTRRRAREPEWTVRADAFELVDDDALAGWEALATKLRPEDLGAAKTMAVTLESPDEGPDQPYEQHRPQTSRPAAVSAAKFPDLTLLDTLPYETAPIEAVETLARYFHAAQVVDDYVMIFEIRKRLRAMRPAMGKAGPKRYEELWGAVNKLHPRHGRGGFLTLRQIVSQFVVQQDQVQRGDLILWLEEAKPLAETDSDHRAIAWMHEVLGLNSVDGT